MKIIHLCPSAAFGGAEAVADTLTAMATAAGWNASLVLPVSRDAPPTSVHWRAWALSLRLRADVVHAHLPWPDRLGAVLVAARGLPLVVTFHLLPDTDRKTHSLHDHSLDWPRDRVTTLSSRWMLSLSAQRDRTRWVALNHRDKQHLSAIVGDRVTVIRNAPPQPVLGETPALTWPEGTVRLASVGRLHHQKGFDRMLRALSHPTVRDKPWVWTIVGDGPENVALHTLRDTLGLHKKVTFAGTLRGTAAIAHADLVLSPSRFEGMPLVPLEAAEARVPVLASSIAAHQELFSATPTALLPDDESRWPSVLATLIDSQTARDALAEQTVRAVGHDPRGATWAAYEKLYREVCRR